MPGVFPSVAGKASRTGAAEVIGQALDAVGGSQRYVVREEDEATDLTR